MVVWRVETVATLNEVERSTIWLRMLVMASRSPPGVSAPLKNPPPMVAVLVSSVFASVWLRVPKPTV